MTGDARAAALDRLGLAPDAAAGAARAAVLRRLAESSYLPEPADHEAALAALGRDPGPAPHLAAAAAEVHRAAVAAFAADFFATPPDARRAAWAELACRCGDSAAAIAWLRQLEPGLDVAVPPAAPRDRLVARLAADALGLFVLEPAARPAATRARAWDLARDPALGDRDRARRRLRRLYPGIAGLATDYLDRAARPAPAPRVAGRAPGQAASWSLGAGLKSPWLLVFCLITLFRVLQGQQARPDRPAARPIVPIPRMRPSSRPASPTAIAPIPPTLPDDPATADLRRGIEDRLRGPIRAAAIRVGVRFHDGQVRAVVAAIPLGPAPGGADLRAAFGRGEWSPDAIDALDAALRDGLGPARAGLPPAQADLVAGDLVRAIVSAPPAPAPAPAGGPP